MSKAAKAKRLEDLDTYSKPDDVLACLRSHLPDGVPMIGITGDEALTYVNDFNRFASTIREGGLYSVQHCFGIVACRPTRTLPIPKGGSMLVVDDSENDIDQDDKKARREAFFKGAYKVPSDEFVIDDAFIIRAWTIGVIRWGILWSNSYDDYMDTAIQIARWGFVNQGCSAPSHLE
jgi:hypothetical protein